MEHVEKEVRSDANLSDAPSECLEGEIESVCVHAHYWWEESCSSLAVPSGSLVTDKEL